jgi:hypothetical protein
MQATKEMMLGDVFYTVLAEMLQVGQLTVGVSLLVKKFVFKSV